ncbi:MAG: hypothetical protein ACYTFQ_32065 [Planctomycetota bacterium]
MKVDQFAGGIYIHCQVNPAAEAANLWRKVPGAKDISNVLLFPQRIRTSVWVGFLSFINFKILYGIFADSRRDLLYL